MNRGCIEYRDNSILRSDGAYIYANHGVSMASLRQLVWIVGESEEKKPEFIPEMFQKYFSRLDFKYKMTGIYQDVYVRPDGENAVAKLRSIWN